MGDNTYKRGLFQSTKSLKNNMQKQSTRWDQANITANTMSPVLVTAYPLNTETSSVYAGTEEAKSYVGPDSPFRYDKINDYRIFIDTEIFGPDTKEEYGFQIDSSLNVNLLPGVVNLEDNSILCLQTMPGLYFKVSNSNLSRVMPNTYSQSMLSVAFTSADTEKVAWLEKQVVNEYTMTKYNQGSYVLSNKVLAKRDDLYDIQEDILDSFLSLYYSEDIGSVSFRNEDTIVYDPYLVTFLTRNSVLSARSNKIFKLCNDIECVRDKDFDILYRQSIFGRIERKKKITSSLGYSLYSYKLYEEITKWSRFHEMKLDNNILIYTRATTHARTGVISYAPLNSNIPLSTTTLDDVINTYLSTEVDDIKSELFDVLDDYYEPRSYDNMVKLALCMFILEKKIASLHGRNMDSNIIKEVQ